MWGFKPAETALLAGERFAESGVKNVLIPGIGYGRNASVFTAKGMEVTGIEISKTAIELAKMHDGQTLKMYHGSVTDMPFDTVRYDGIFCYALIHLLDGHERAKLIRDCYAQLSDAGIMFFTALSKKASTYGQGTLIDKDRFEQFGGVKMFFYDEDTVRDEFGNYGLFKIEEVVENYPFYFIQCRKNAAASPS